MDLKKANRANLERKRGMHFIIGAIVSMSLILISFEWTRTINIKEDLKVAKEIVFEEDMIQVTRRDEQKKQVNLPAIDPILVLVEEEIEFEEFEFDPEVTGETNYEYFRNIVVEEEEDIPDDIHFSVVEDKPAFNGDETGAEFYKYVMQHLRYPEIAARNGVEGRVHLEFDIDKSGNLVNATVTYGAHPDLDNEALRVVRSSPKWTPGRQRGKAVKVSYNFSVKFELR